MTRQEEYALGVFEAIDFSDALSAEEYAHIAKVCFDLADALEAEYRKRISPPETK